MTSPTPVWFITGAGSGFGHGIALEALSRGHHVVATSRRLSSLSSLAAAGAAILDLDVTAPEDVVEAKVHEAVDVYGRLTYVVNAAGYVLEGACEEASAQETLDQFNTNVLGLIKVTRATIPHLRSLPSPSPSPSSSPSSPLPAIANFGSLASWNGLPATALYNSTKWAVSGYTEALAAELLPLRIGVTCVEPGMFRTGFLGPGRRVGTRRRLPAVYAETAEKTRQRLDAADGKQLGDVARGAEMVVDVLTGTGVAEGRRLPLRLVLGSDCYGVIKDKCESTLELLKEWEHVAVSTDHDDMK